MIDLAGSERAANTQVGFRIIVHKVKLGPIYDPYVREVPVREDTCPGPSAL